MTAVELLASSFQVLSFMVISESERYVDCPRPQSFPFNMSRSFSKLKRVYEKTSVHYWLLLSCRFP